MLHLEISLIERILRPGRLHDPESAGLRASSQLFWDNLFESKACRTQRMKTMKKNTKIAAAAALSAVFLLGGCASDGTYYRADTYTANQVNRVQEVKTVEIIAINAARVAVPNSSNRETAQIAGAILGAIAGAAIGNHNNHSTSARVMGGLAGGAVGGLAGSAVGGDSTTYTDGVQIIYKTAGGRVLQTSQVGQPCEFKTGTAILVAPTPSEARIQPNNPYGCPRK